LAGYEGGAAWAQRPVAKMHRRGHRDANPRWPVAWVASARRWEQAFRRRTLGTDGTIHPSKRYAVYGPSTDQAGNLAPGAWRYARAGARRDRRLCDHEPLERERGWGDAESPIPAILWNECGRRNLPIITGCPPPVASDARRPQLPPAGGVAVRVEMLAGASGAVGGLRILARFWLKKFLHIGAGLTWALYPPDEGLRCLRVRVVTTGPP
jgi:hypothetical protein